MRKYIHLAKCLKPKLSEAACEVISNEYSRLRSQDTKEADVARTQPVTARTLETLIRLSTAHAKARMAKTVSVDDAHAAIELVQYAYFKKVLEKEKRKRQRSVDSSEEEEIVREVEVGAATATRSSKRVRTEQSKDPESDSELMDDLPADAGDLTQRATIAVASTPAAQSPAEEIVVEAVITGERLKVFQNLVQAAFRKIREQSIPLEDLVRIINQDLDEAFEEGEITAAIARMTDSNKIMLADGIVFLI